MKEESNNKNALTYNLIIICLVMIFHYCVRILIKKVNSNSNSLIKMKTMSTIFLNFIIYMTIDNDFNNFQFSLDAKHFRKRFNLIYTVSE